MPQIKSNIKSMEKDAARHADSAAQKGVLHKNTAARKKSRLAAKVNEMDK